MLIIAGAAVIARNPRPVHWHGLDIVVLFLSSVPFLQLTAGMLPFSGVAWVGTAYLLGFLLILLVGAHWEMAEPGGVGNGLFLAIGIAALLSIGLQLREWLGVTWDSDSLQIWSATFTPGRPSANLGQPNQLATILIWALLGCAWGVVRHKVRPVLAILFAVLVIFGIALTQSRIALVSLVSVTLAVWWWRRFFSACAPWVVTSLLIYFLVCIFSLQAISDFLGLDVQIRSASMGGESTHLRLTAYRIFGDAVWQKPLWGYGWNQLVVAQLSVAQDHPAVGAFFVQSHNLFLDFLLWFGVPTGVFLSTYIIYWWIRCVVHVKNLQDILLVMFVLVVGLHAMVELPLHHAYLLLPTGLVIGALNQRMNKRVIWASSRWPVWGIGLGACLLLAVIMRDYLQIDESFRTIRLESAHIGRLPPGKPPEVLVLNDLRELIYSARLEVKPDINADDMERLRKVTLSFPTPYNLFNLAKALAFRHRPEDARLLIQKMQKAEPDGYDLDMHRIWDSQARNQPAMAAVRWPALEVNPVKSPNLQNPLAR